MSYGPYPAGTGDRSREVTYRRKVCIYKDYSFTHTNYLTAWHGPEIWAFPISWQKLVVYPWEDQVTSLIALSFSNVLVL